MSSWDSLRGLGGSLLCGALAGGISTMCTFPLDSVLRNLQVHLERS